MDIFITTFTAVGTLLFIGLVGFTILSRHLLIENALGPLSVLAIDIALPCLIFANIIRDFHPETYPLWWTLPIWWLGFTALLWLMTTVLTPVSQKATRREFRFSLFFHNGIFFPLAIIVEMFGADSVHVVDLFLFTLFYPAFFFNTAPLFFGKKMQSLNWARIFNPVLAATVVAILIKLTGAHEIIPSFVVSGLRLVGNMAVPLLMIILGGNIFLDLRRPGKLAVHESLKFILIKNIVFPLIVLGVLILLKPPYYIALIVMIQSAVPPITAVPILTEREGGNRTIVNQFMIASFGISLITLPVMILLFSRVFPA
ncbi:MAG TPA: AEC family transporter [Deltaproteobacteria bacterium]|nr:AEC family transporter [Deltaproteobacteria bacterium]